MARTFPSLEVTPSSVLAATKHLKRYPNFDKKVCELLAILICKFDAFAKGFSKHSPEAIQFFELLEWVDEPSDEEYNSEEAEREKRHQRIFLDHLR